MRVEIIMRWLKFITMVRPIIGLIATLAVLLVFNRPIRQILEQFNCSDVVRFRIGPFEIEKSSRRKPARARPKNKRFARP